MRIAILTFDGFNELDSFIAFGLLNRLKPQGWKAEIASPTAVQNLQRLRREFEIVLVTDEASLYDARSFEHFDGLGAVVLVQRPDGAGTRTGGSLTDRMQAHCHRALTDAVRHALDRYHPELVQVEHVELAELSALRAPGQRWILGLHDAYDPGDFTDADTAARFQDHVVESYDAITVCSAEDQAMIAHPRTVCVPNGISGVVEDQHDPTGLVVHELGVYQVVVNAHHNRTPPPNWRFT